MNSTRAEFSRPCILLLSPHCSYRLGPYIAAAEKFNTDIIVVSQGEHSLVSAVASGLHVNFKEAGTKQKIIDAVKNKQVLAVIGTDDLTVELAAEVSQTLGLTHNDPAAIKYTRRKDLARECLKHAPVHIPLFEKHSLRSLLEQPELTISYPCIIKPLALSGSRGVIRINNNEELHAACQRLLLILQHIEDEDEREQVLIEAYIPGYEYAFEGLLDKGRLQTLALFDKPDLMEGPFFEETYYITPSRLPEDLQKKIHLAVTQACEAYGLREGPVHAEVRVHENEIWFMEMASRTIGGQCAQLLHYATGMKLEDIVIAQACQMKLDIQAEQQAAGVLMIPIIKRGLLRRVEGLLAASRIEFIEDIEISIQEGYEIIPLPEGDSYLGFIFAKAPSAEKVEQALRQAYGKLKIVTSPILNTS